MSRTIDFPKMESELEKVVEVAKEAGQIEQLHALIGHVLENLDKLIPVGTFTSALRDNNSESVSQDRQPRVHCPKRVRDAQIGIIVDCLEAKGGKTTLYEVAQSVGSMLVEIDPRKGRTASDLVTTRAIEALRQGFLVEDESKLIRDENGNVLRSASFSLSDFVHLPEQSARGVAPFAVGDRGIASAGSRGIATMSDTESARANERASGVQSHHQNGYASETNTSPPTDHNGASAGNQ